MRNASPTGHCQHSIQAIDHLREAIAITVALLTRGLRGVRDIRAYAAERLRDSPVLLLAPDLGSCYTCQLAQVVSEMAGADPCRSGVTANPLERAGQGSTRPARRAWALSLYPVKGRRSMRPRQHELRSYGVSRCAQSGCVRACWSASGAQCMVGRTTDVTPQAGDLVSGSRNCDHLAEPAEVCSGPTTIAARTA